MFGDSHIEQIAESYNLSVIGKIPMEPKLAAACDAGTIELYEGDWLDSFTKILENLD